MQEIVLKNKKHGMAMLLTIILLFVIGATITSVHAPAKRIRGMSITDTINEL